MTVLDNNKIRSKNSVDEDVKRLKEWLSKQPHLPHDIDDEILVPFVRGTKSLEIAKQKLDAWCSAKTKVPPLFGEEARDPTTEDFRLKNRPNRMFFLPRLTPDGYLVLWHVLGEDFKELFNHTHMILRSTMLIELGMVLYPESKGLVVVYDFKGVPASVMSRVSPSMTAASLHWFQNSMPIKLKKVFVINSFPVIEVLMNNIIKPFLKEKLYKRIDVTNEGVGIVRKYLGSELIPQNYDGGKCGSPDIMDAEWQTKMEERAEWFQKTSKFATDELKRPADKNGTYGVEGTFRSLAID